MNYWHFPEFIKHAIKIESVVGCHLPPLNSAHPSVGILKFVLGGVGTVSEQSVSRVVWLFCLSLQFPCGFLNRKQKNLFSPTNVGIVG